MKSGGSSISTQRDSASALKMTSVGEYLSGSITPMGSAGRPLNRLLVLEQNKFCRPMAERRNSSSKPPIRDLLTPMPEYLKPIIQSAPCRLKKLRDDHMMEKLLSKRNARKKENLVIREGAKNIIKTLPFEILAQDWLSDQQASVETRAFLVDRVLPTLILGIEKLLVEVDKRHLAEKEDSDPNFNPLNFLAQYLMRNNPRYSNFSEASSYIRGLREITEGIRQELFAVDENRLVKIKGEAKRRREAREWQDHLYEVERERRVEATAKQFPEWNVGLYSDCRVELALLQNALRSFAEMAEKFPDELQETSKYKTELDVTDDTGKTLNLQEYSQYLDQYICDLPSELFDQFMLHMSQCAIALRRQTEREQRRVLLTNLFVSCDRTGVGLLDRHRMLNLFEKFYDKVHEDFKPGLRNPRKWPVVEITESDDNFYDDNEEEITSRQLAVDDTDNMLIAAQSGQFTTSEAAEKTQSEELVISSMDESVADRIATEKPAEVGESEPQAERPATGKSETERVEVTGEETDGSSAEKTEEKTEKKTEEPPAETADAPTDVTRPDSQSAAKPIEEMPEESPPVTAKLEGGGDVSPPADVRSALEDTQVSGRDDADGQEEEEEQEEESRSDSTRNSEDLERLDMAKTSTGMLVQSPQYSTAEIGLLDLQKDAEFSAENAERGLVTQQSKVSFAEGTSFEKDRNQVTSRSQSRLSAFDEAVLNLPQFVQLTETFLGDAPERKVIQRLVAYVSEGYVETEDERLERIIKVRHEEQLVKRRAQLNNLFEMWDNDASGYLNMEEVEVILKRYKEGSENDAILKAKKELNSSSKRYDTRLTKREFREFILKVVDKMSGMDVFDYLLEYLLSNVERSYAERIRGEARKKWLQLITSAAETSGANMEPVYNLVFQALHKDAEAHGECKTVSAYVAMLEENSVAPVRGSTLLLYVACTPSNAPFLLGRALFKDMKGISFSSVASGKPIHVPKVATHGNIHFWNPNRAPYERDGSFIVVPLKDRNRRVFGLLGVDTLNDLCKRSIFITHEIQFYQGVAKAFSIAFHHVDVRQKMMRIGESAISWIRRRSPHVREVTVYMVEPDKAAASFVLRRMMHTDEKGQAAVLSPPARLQRKDNLFRDYLFKCVDNSESVTADAYGERHLAVPLRDDKGWAIVVVDVSIGDEKELPRAESFEVMKMLKLLQMAYKEISHEAHSAEKQFLLEGERESDETRTNIMFDRLMLMELRENVGKLDSKAYAELKSYKEPPVIVHLIIKAVLAIFYHEMAIGDKFDDWKVCKQFMKSHLTAKIVDFDPTAEEPADDPAPVELINSYLNDVPHGAVLKHGSRPAQYLYNWVFVCVSLIEHTRKTHANRPTVITDIQPLATSKSQLAPDEASASDDSDDKKISITTVGASMPAEDSAAAADDTAVTADDTTDDTAAAAGDTAVAAESTVTPAESKAAVSESTVTTKESTVPSESVAEQSTAEGTTSEETEVGTANTVKNDQISE